MKATDTARDQAQAQLESIREMVAALNTDDDAREEAEQAIQEDPLSVEVRSGWHTLGAEAEAAEYMILLCTGGPACRIRGELNGYGEPETAVIEYQDWGTPWTPYGTTEAEEGDLLDYARVFYYGS